MITKKFVVGRFFTNCYIATCKNTKEAIIIDPGYEDQIEAQEFFRYIDSNSLRIKSIVDTHGHPDHTCGNGIMKKKFQVPILIHEKDSTYLVLQALYLDSSLSKQCHLQQIRYFTRGTRYDLERFH